MDWFAKLLDKASPQDIVALAGLGLTYWLVTTKRQIARGTVELALKCMTGIVIATIAARVVMADLTH